MKADEWVYEWKRDGEREGGRERGERASECKIKNNNKTQALGFFNLKIIKKKDFFHTFI